MPQRQCSATTKAGNPCHGPALPNEDLCFTHSPTKADERAARNRRGGRNKDATVRATKVWVAAGREVQPGELPALLYGMVGAVASGELEPGRASAIAQLVKTALVIETQLRWDAGLADLESELARLEGAQPVPRYLGSRAKGRR
jgi:hypothetical protein